MTFTLTINNGWYIIPETLTALTWLWHWYVSRKPPKSTGNSWLPIPDFTEMFSFVIAIILTLSIWLVFFAVMYFTK